MSLTNNRKGQAENWFAIIIFILFFGIFSIFGVVLTTAIVDGYKDSGLYEGAIQETGDKFINALALYDTIIIVLLIALILSLALTNLRLAANPAFFIVTFIMSAFYGLVSYFFNFVFVEFASQEAVSTALVLFPKTIFLCTNLHWIMLLNIVIGSITLWAKRPKGQFVE